MSWGSSSSGARAPASSGGFQSPPQNDLPARRTNATESTEDAGTALLALLRKEGWGDREFTKFASSDCAQLRDFAHTNVISRDSSI